MFPKSNLVPNKALFQNFSEDAFGHLQIQRRIAKNLCSKGKKTFQSPHIIYRDMFPAKMLPGNRSFFWERTQITHLSGMPMLRVLEFHYKIWDELCSRISIHGKGLRALPSLWWPFFIGRLTGGSSPLRKESWTPVILRPNPYIFWIWHQSVQKEGGEIPVIHSCPLVAWAIFTAWKTAEKTATGWTFLVFFSSYL